MNKSVVSEKSLGILIHPSSLPGESECGTFGEVAKNWIKKLAKYGIEYWQILPLSPTDETGSPYSSPSSFALNPWFLDINELIEEGFIFISNKEELGINYEKNDYLNFEMANKLTEELGKHILKAWESQSEQRKNDFFKWTKMNSWVEDYSIFTLLREEFNKLPWWEWPKEFKQKDIEYLHPWIQKNSSALLTKKLIQWHLDKQWRSIKQTASSFGVNIIGDLPFYVSRDSVDVWSNKSLFSISKNGDLLFQSGVPPDYFSSTGQLWGTPTYFWAKHRRTNFDWWRRRFKRQFELADILRLDHFRALAGYWRVQGNSKTAIDGKWINSPGKELLNELKKDLKVDYLPIIAEDLGVITPDVEKLRDNFKLPGMKILQFAFDGNSDNPYLPQNIKGNNWVVYTGTHDNETSTSWWESLEFDLKMRINSDYKYSDNPSWNLMEIGMNTSANLLIVPIQDLLSLNNSCRLNTPGTIKNNWRWKLNKPLEEIESYLKQFGDRGNNYGRRRN